MSSPITAPLLGADAARMLGVGTSRLRDLDDDLRPARTPGGVRIYDAAAVEAYAAERARRRTARDQGG